VPRSAAQRLHQGRIRWGRLPCRLLPGLLLELLNWSVLGTPLTAGPRGGPATRVVSVSVLLGSLVLLDLRIGDGVCPAVITGGADCFGVAPDDLPPVAADLHPVTLLDGVAVVAGGGAVLDLVGTP
jgi:hypothetical protein